MTAYDVAAWTDLANTVAGGAAALAGLMFVGLSLNLTDVLSFPGVAARAAATMGLTIAVLLVAVFVATPGQDVRAMAAEIGALGVRDGGGSGGRRAVSAVRPEPESRVGIHGSALLPGPLLIIGAISLWFQSGGGLYWVTAAVAVAFASASATRGCCLS